MKPATKHYTWAAFVAMAVGWLAGVISWAVLRHFLPCESQSGEIEAISFALLSLPVVLLIHLLFIQLPSKFIQKVFFETTTLLFAIISTAYGAFLFAIVFNSFLLRDINAESFDCSFTLVMLIVSAINGFVFGLVFHSFWKPNQAPA